MDSEGKRQGLEQVRARIEELRIEIEDLTKTDKRDRLTRQSGVPWDGRTQHEARIVRINEIKEELAKLKGGKK
jgi:archaellum component FlaC